MPLALAVALGYRSYLQFTLEQIKALFNSSLLRS